MQKKILYGLCFTAGVMGLVSCSGSSTQTSVEEYVNNTPAVNRDAYYLSENERFFISNPDEAAQVFNKRVPPLNSLIVCRDKQCAPAELSKSREYIFNALAQLVDNNVDSTALLCEANPQAHVCTNPYLTVPAKIGVTPAYVYFDGVKLIDAAIADGKTALNLILGYNLSYNGQTPTICKPDEAMLYVKNNNKIVLNGNGFKCDMTSVGTTKIRVMFNVDYIDLDYGYIGGYYTIGLSGPAYGGGSGYGLIRLIKDAHPLSPELRAPQQDEEAEESKTPVKPFINSEALKINDEEAGKALAQVEVKDGTEKKAAAKDKDVLTERKPLQTNVSYGSSDVRENSHSSHPLSLTPDTVVTSDKVILKPDRNIPPVYEIKDEDFGPEFEEIYIDDLDEYIK